MTINVLRGTNRTGDRSEIVNRIHLLITSGSQVKLSNIRGGVLGIVTTKLYFGNDRQSFSCNLIIQYYSSAEVLPCNNASISKITIILILGLAWEGRGG